MKTLQNDFTTPEQSKRLLELGIPVDSANFSMTENGKNVEALDGILYSEYINRAPNNLSRSRFLPCWSVGRLIEIAHICSDSTLSYKEEANEIQKFKEEHKCETLIEAVIVCIEDAVSIGSINFSKLEE